MNGEPQCSYLRLQLEKSTHFGGNLGMQIAAYALDRYERPNFKSHKNPVAKYDLKSRDRISYRVKLTCRHNFPA